MKKSKTRKKTTFTTVERDSRITWFVSTGLNAMHVCRHSGLPDQGLLIGRSVFPMLVTQIHVAMAEHHHGQSSNRMLEDLNRQRIISDVAHLSLRRAAASLSDYGSGRDLQDLIDACDVLQAITRSEAYYIARKAKRAAKANKSAKVVPKKRPLIVRWAAAAAGLFSFGASS